MWFRAERHYFCLRIAGTIMCKRRHYRAVVLYHTDEKVGKVGLRRRQEVQDSRPSQAGYSTSQTPGSIPALGLLKISLTSYTKGILSGLGWMAWTSSSLSCHSLPEFYTTNINTKQLVALMLLHPKAWSRTLPPQTRTREGSQKGPWLTLFLPLLWLQHAASLKSGSQTHPLSYLFSTLNDSKVPRIDHRSLQEPQNSWNRVYF